MAPSRLTSQAEDTEKDDMNEPSPRDTATTITKGAIPEFTLDRSPTEEDLRSLRDALWGVDREAAAVSEPKHCCALCDLAEKILKVLS